MAQQAAIGFRSSKSGLTGRRQAHAAPCRPRRVVQQLAVAWAGPQHGYVAMPLPGAATWWAAGTQQQEQRRQFWGGCGCGCGSWKHHGCGHHQLCRLEQHQQQQPADADDDGNNRLALDVVADASFYLLYADVPGMAKPDLTIRLSKERRLTISGQRARPALEGGAGSVNERRFGPFSRSWALPDDADTDGISASVADGVLTITVPRLPRQQLLLAAQAVRAAHAPARWAE